MKLIEAVIPPERLDAVKEALRAAEIHRMTVSEVQGLSLTKGEEGLEGSDYAPRLMLRIEIGVNEGFVRPTMQALLQEAQGGKVFVIPLHEVVRIRTGERGPEAI